MKNILLIEDAPQVAGILIAKLQREGHSLQWVRNDDAAMEALKGGRFDLILLSTYLLPKRNAWELLQALKTRHAPETAVVMLLESEEMALRDRALAEGAVDVIQKPFKPTVVAKLIRELPEQAAV